MNDANDWAAVLNKRGFSVEKILDKQATDDAIRKAIKVLATRAKRGDLVVVQYSGHGSFVCPTMMATNLTARTNVHARTISPAKDPLRTTRCSTSYSYEYFEGRPNGAFTFAALRALESLKRKATYRDWFKEIRKPLPSQQYSQRPNLYGSTSMGRWKMFE